MRRRYPLESLCSLRREQVHASTHQLGKQRERLQQSMRARERAQLVLKDEQERARKVRAAERDRLARGAIRASDLAQAEQWARGAEERAQKLREAEARALGEERRQAEAVEHARVELASAEAKAQAVQRHRERWQAVQASAEERTEEDRALDAWTARHLLGKGRV